MIDTDEYLAFNYYDPLERGVTWCVNNATCDEEYLDTIRGGTHFRTKLNQSATAAEYIAKNVGQKVPSGVNPRLSSVDDKGAQRMIRKRRKKPINLKTRPEKIRISKSVLHLLGFLSFLSIHGNPSNDDVDCIIDLPAS